MPDQVLPIFISYASYDNTSSNPEERWLDRLLQFLKPLDLKGKIATWADTALLPGANWRSQIRDVIERAKVAILLVSPAFLASEFIQSQELPRLLQQANPRDEPVLHGPDNLSEGMLVLPILLRPCLIDYVSFEVLDGPSESRIAKLTDFQYVPKGSAMNGLSQYEQDRQFEIIARRIIDAVGEAQGPEVAAINARPEDLDELSQDLLRFLGAYSRWWFNALRIRNWGVKQLSFEGLSEYSVTQIGGALEKLVRENKIQKKPGKRSVVYKSKSDA